MHITQIIHFSLLEFPYAWIAPLVGTTTYFPVLSLSMLHDPETGAAVALQSTAARIAQVRNLMKAIADVK